MNKKRYDRRMKKSEQIEMANYVVVIGNFDGVHTGHRALIDHARMIAEERGLLLALLTFEPHPRRYFLPDHQPFRLTPKDMKATILSSLCDCYIALDFNADMVAKTADEFMRDILIARCNAKVVVVGENFHFGKGRAGDIHTLKGCDAFETVGFGMQSIGGEAVSSSRIRNHLEQAEIEQANVLLGWQWCIEGAVIHGDKRGRELGYPTANMMFGDTLIPAHGIYAVKVQIKGENQWRMGVANIGTRPMFHTDTPLLETYIFDFSGDLYDQTLRVMPVRKIRNEMSFNNLDALIEQMEKDCVIAKNILHNA